MQGNNVARDRERASERERISELTLTVGGSRSLSGMLELRTSPSQASWRSRRPDGVEARTHKEASDVAVMPSRRAPVTHAHEFLIIISRKIARPSRSCLSLANSNESVARVLSLAREALALSLSPLTVMVCSLSLLCRCSPVTCS
ncbi:hypothetical protein TSAR_000515 [Trichomalopsis sarcophagae]|uniref:Uncharacterized protein n=1 Tax=Trichomalopsis sarcophagae TaxID=543379 RepID=A0A232EIC5_9HYME|nr:hypothetical protein TSAR_000515 [Trichomalopsis sarcophagae]